MTSRVSLATIQRSMAPNLARLLASLPCRAQHASEGVALVENLVS